MNSFSKQETEYFCGPAVVQMLLHRRGIECTQEELARELETDSVTGTSADALVRVLTSHNIDAVRRNEAAFADIVHALERGCDVIVGYIEIHGDPHYALVHEIDETHIAFTDPYHGESFQMTLTEFSERWRDDEREMYGKRMIVEVSR